MNFRRLGDAAVVLACLASSAIVYARLHSKGGKTAPNPRYQEHLVDGRYIHVPGVDFHNDRGTLVIAVAPDCYLCSVLSSSYNHLIQLATKRKVQVVLISKGDLTRFGIDVRPASHVVAASPAAFGLMISPTVQWIAEDATLEREWAGRFSDVEQRQIESYVSGQPLPPAQLNGDISGALLNNLKDKDEFQIVDIQERPMFALGHRVGSVDIPLEELWARSRHELDQTRPLVIDCSAVTSFNCTFARRLLSAEGFRSLAMLNRGGFIPASCKAVNDRQPM